MKPVERINRVRDESRQRRAWSERLDARAASGRGRRRDGREVDGFDDARATTIEFRRPRASGPVASARPRGRRSRRWTSRSSLDRPLDPVNIPERSPRATRTTGEDAPEVFVVAPQMFAESPYAARDGFATAATPAACRWREERGATVSERSSGYNLLARATAGGFVFRSIGTVASVARRRARAIDTPPRDGNERVDVLTRRRRRVFARARVAFAVDAP